MIYKLMTPTDNHEVTRKNIEVLNRVIFGDTETGEIGMKQKLDEVHHLLVQARSVGGFFGGIGGGLKWLLLIGAVIVLVKSWFTGIISVIASRL